MERSVSWNNSENISIFCACILTHGFLVGSAGSECAADGEVGAVQQQSWSDQSLGIIVRIYLFSVRVY